MSRAEFETKPAPEIVLPKHLHFIGIGGDGMSGLARLLQEQGFTISGSDNIDQSRIKQPKVVEVLRGKGATVYFGQRPVNISPETGLVIRSSAISLDNPEVLKACELGIPVWKRSELLGHLMEPKYGVAIAGCAGKSTTTGMLGVILEKLGFDPTLVVGARIENLGGNFRLGKGKHFIVEADEYDRSFLDLKFKMAILTPIFYGDHMDYYRDEEKMLGAFVNFVQKLPLDGLLACYGEDKNIEKVARYAPCQVVTFGFSPSCEWQAIDLEQTSLFSRFSIVKNRQVLGKCTLQIPGKHNILDALAAISSSYYLGVELEKACDSLLEYKGAKRRLELKGVVNEVTVIDDFGHNPIQIKATLEGLRQIYPGSRVWCVFQPRQFRRTKAMLPGLANSFDLVDGLIIADISRGLGDTEEHIEAVHARDLVEILKKNGKEALYIGSLEGIAGYLVNVLKPNDVLLTLGSGNVYQVADKVLSLLQSH